MEDRICQVSKEVYAAMLEAMPPEARCLDVESGQTRIVLISPLGYRLYFEWQVVN
jgi:hypothetical protein